MTRPGTTAAAHAAVQQASTIGHALGLHEFAPIRGAFDMQLFGPREDCRADYMRLFDRAHLLRQDVQAQEQSRLRRLLAAGNIFVPSKRDELERMEAEYQAMQLLLRQDHYLNTVTDVGARYLLDNGLAGSAYTAAFYLGIISSTSYSAIAAADTMSSHAGWLEAGSANTPVYSESARRTAAWSAASSRSKALSAALVFTFTGSGTVKGSFLTTVSTKDGTTGTLYSAGLFSGGDQPVVNGNTISVSYTASV